MYPSIEEEVNALRGRESSHYRIARVGEIEKKFEDEVSKRTALGRRYGRSSSGLEITSNVCTSIAAVSSISGIAVSTTVVGLPVGLALEGVAILSASLTLGSSLISRRLRDKQLKHVRLASVADQCLSAIHRLMSKALRDGVISDAEFAEIQSLEEEYVVRRERIQEESRNMHRGEMKAKVKIDELNEIETQLQEQLKIKEEEIKSLGKKEKSITEKLTSLNLGSLLE